MAAYNLQEQEQIDDLKAWWGRFGGAITAGLVLGALLIVGVQGWRWYTAHRAEQASALYSAVTDAARKNELPRARDAIAELEGRYAGTGYAPRAALVYARVLYDAGDKAGAKTQLQWVVDHSSEDEIQAVARYRLAQIQVDEKQYDQALAMLDAKHPESFDGVYADLRGDALAGAGRAADARAAYQVAIAKLDPQSSYVGFVRVKLDALGGPPQAAGGVDPAAAAAAASAAAAAAGSAAPAASGASAAPAASPNGAKPPAAEVAKSAGGGK
jgi:predicted negative regulator of RcsB-dependent stress response